MGNSFDTNDNLSDNELVKLIISGEYESLRLLIDRYMPYILSVVKKYGNCGCDSEDLIQEARLALFSAVKAYDSSKAAFSTFAMLCISRAISGYVRASSPARKIPDELISPIYEVKIADSNSPEKVFFDMENYKSLTAAIKQLLSEKEYMVLCGFLSGKSYADIAEVLNIDEKSVDNALKRLRTKLKCL